MKVLIVDDDRATVDVIRCTMDWERLGIAEVYEAYNISMAQEILLEQAVDIVISDIEMPQGSGLDLLAWFREKHMEGEFLLLTCHEKFSYATDAVKLHAAEYILKPFDADVMEAALKKLVLKIKEDRQIRQERQYGQWVVQNKRQLQLSFLEDVFSGKLEDGAELTDEIFSRRLDLSENEDYVLVVTKVTDIERDRVNISPELMRFFMENIHSELLCGDTVNHSVVVWQQRNHYLLVTVCPNQKLDRMQEKCEQLMEEFHRVFTATITCGICDPCRITEFYRTFLRVSSIMDTAVVYYGRCFRVSQYMDNKKMEEKLPDFATLEKLIRERKKMELLSLLKTWMSEKAAGQKMNSQTLYRLRQEMLQVVYTYLGRQGVPAQGLASDEALLAMEQKATQSMTDMIRFVNLLTEKTFAYEDKIRGSFSLVEKINQYIRENYKKSIGRTEIAAEFYLAPEYVSKLYKKETGKSLKDAISECRIEQAMLLLKRGDVRVSDVAEAVGFDNFTYFSTLFKKYTGMTPNQYKKGH